jgi:PAS domain S-box-containing protein
MQDLVTTEAFCRRLFQASAFGIMVVDHAGRIVLANPALAAMFGYSAEELSGQPVELLLPAHLRETHVAHRAAYAAELGSRPMGDGMDVWGLRKDGQPFPVEVSLSSLPLGEQAVSVAFVTDITARKQAEEVQAQLAAIVDSSDDSIIGSTLDGTILTWNAGAERLYGYTAEEAIGRSVSMLIPPDRAGELARLVERMNRGERLSHYETVRIRKDGRPLDVAFTFSPIRNARGTIIGISAITRDISAHTRAKRALRRQTTFVQLLQSIAVAANQAWSVEAAMQTAVEQICIQIGWPVGHVYLARDDAPGALASTAIWYLADPDRFVAFRKATEAISTASTDDLLGQVLASSKPKWIADMLLVPGMLRARQGSDIEVRAGFAFPVLLGDKVVAVLEFFSAEANEPDEALLDIMVHVGTQLGRVVERVRAEAALRAAEAQYRTLVERVPAIIFVADAGIKATTHYISPQVEAILGFTPQAWLSDSEFWIKRLHPDDRERVLAVIGDTPAGTERPPLEYRMCARDGRVHWFHSLTWVVQGEAQRPLLAQGILLDITERKLAEEALQRSEQLYRTVANNFPNGALLLFDRDLRYTVAGGMGLDKVGLSRELLEGKTLHDLFPPEVCKQVEPMYHAALAGSPSVQEMPYADRFYLVYTIPVRDEHGEVYAGMVMTQDISERKRVEQALVDERALLARRVEERTADLSAANAELARTARLKDEFLASMSHELRTPLNAVLGLSEALQEQVYGPMNVAQLKALKNVEESGRHLLDLINDILDLAKIGAGKLNLALGPVVLGTVCQASVRLIKPEAHKKRLMLETMVDPTISLLRADARRLKQVIVNLLSNAVKFTPEGGTIGLEVVGDVARQVVRLTVWDSGIGIAEEDLGRLFQPFVQLDSRLARQYNGTGLGLALVYRIVELHGGGMSVTSEPGVGSRFTVSLPWYGQVGAVAPSGTSPAPTTSVPAILPVIRQALIVEDSPTAAAQLVRYLDELGVIAVTHPQGEDAIARVLEVQPDLIILDILLPDTSGWEVLERLKAEPCTRSIPVLIVSVMDDRAYGLALGAADYLVKPFTRQDVQQVLYRLGQVGGNDTHQAPQAPLEQALQHPTILLAEDNEANITTILDYLRAKGYQVVVARNGAEAIVRAHEVRPAIILMDIQMPGMDGLEAIRRIRANLNVAQTPIIALTALAMPGDRERCLAAGADDYLSKPVSLRGLALAIQAQLQQRLARQGAQ